MAFRFDLGTLKPAKRMDDGRVRADAHLTKTGVFEYTNEDGSTRRELRLPEEVFDSDSMDSFAQVPVTNEHPPELLHSQNSKKYMIGATGEKVVRDDDHVRGSIMVADANTIQEMEAGKLAVSCGYTCDVDHTPGVHPKFGRYDAVQRNIRGNHVAIVSRARAGDSARVRMDAYGSGAAMRKLDIKGYLYDDDDEEQDVDNYDDDLSSEARNKLSDEDFALPKQRKLPLQNEGHVRAAMGGHGLSAVKGITPEERASAAKKIHAAAKKHGIEDPGFAEKHGLRSDHNPRSTVKTSKKDRDNEANLLEAAATQLASATARADEAEGKLADETKRADEAEGRVESLQARVKQLESTRADSAELEKLKGEKEALMRQLARADKARVDAESPDRFNQAVRARVAIEHAALLTLGTDRETFDGLSDRELMTVVVKKLQGVTLASSKSDDYVRARFDSAMEGFRAGAEALAHMREQASAPPTPHIDSRSAREKMIERQQNAWKAPASHTQQESK